MKVAKRVVGIGALLAASAAATGCGDSARNFGSDSGGAGGSAAGGSAAGGSAAGGRAAGGTATGGSAAGTAGSVVSGGAAGASIAAGAAGEPNTEAGAGGEAGAASPECDPGSTRCASRPERREACSSAGTWTLVEDCSPGALCQGAGVSCLKPNGAVCAAASECLSGACTLFYHDADMDTFGSLTDTEQVCGSAAPAGYVTNSRDCCDSDANAKPGQATYFDTADACGNYDYNCLNGEEPDPTQNHVLGTQMCDTVNKTCTQTAGWSGSLPACGQTSSWYSGCFVSGFMSAVFCEINAAESQTWGCN